MKWAQKHKGFTIVELLIVVVVIAILAAITIVAYNGITQRAKASAAQSLVSQTATKVALYAAANGDQYPTTLALAGVTNTDDLQYISNGTTFCITGASQNISYYQSNITTKPAPGACDGHGANGAATIANLATDPRATSLTVPANGAGWTTQNWFGTGGAGTHQLITGAVDGPVGLSTYVRKTWTTAPSSNAATGMRNSTTNANGLRVTAGSTYTFSSWLRASKAQPSAATLRVEWVDNAGASLGSPAYNPFVTLTANTWTRLNVTATAPSGAAYAGIITHVDSGTTWIASDRLDGTGLMITEGSTLYNYGDGASAGWAWIGTPNNSTSTGPVL